MKDYTVYVCVYDSSSIAVNVITGLLYRASESINFYIQIYIENSVRCAVENRK